MEDREEFGKKTAGVREEPVREVDEKIDMAAKAFETMDPAGELTIDDLRTQLEAKLGSETTAVKEVRQLQDLPSFLPCRPMPPPRLWRWMRQRRQGPTTRAGTEKRGVFWLDKAIYRRKGVREQSQT